MPVRSCVYYVVNVGSEAPAYSLIQFRRKFVTRNYYPSWNEVNKVREMNGKSKVGNNITAAQQSWYYIRKGQRSRLSRDVDCFRRRSLASHQMMPPRISIDAHRHVSFPSSLSISITTARPVFSAPRALPVTSAAPFPEHTAHSKCPRTEANIGTLPVPTLVTPLTRTGPRWGKRRQHRGNRGEKWWGESWWWSRVLHINLAILLYTTCLY